MNEKRFTQQRVLLVCAHRPGRSPSQRYRFEQYLPFLAENGFVFEFSYLLNAEADKVFYGPGNPIRKAFLLASHYVRRFKDLLRLKHFDVVFIQREALFTGSSFFERRVYASGKRVIFDFDDSIWLADTSPGNKKWEWIKSPAKFHTNVRAAHLVIAGNAYLADVAQKLNANTIVIPTTVDTTLHFPVPSLRGKERLVIGWSGSISTLRHFRLLAPALIRLKQKYGEAVEVRVLGTSSIDVPGLPVTAKPWTAESENAELNQFDIGVMPLPDDEWSRGKCGLKALTYMACGIPVVASPVGVNREIVHHGSNGFLAATETEWLECLSALLEQKELRHRLGQAGRQTVVEHYSVDRWKNAYLAAFSGQSV